MRLTGMYLVGYVVFVLGVLAALWKTHVLQHVGTTWTVIGLVIAVGLGIMLSVSGSGDREDTIRYERR
jgi:hypothetical protein